MGPQASGWASGERERHNTDGHKNGCQYIAVLFGLQLLLMHTTLQINWEVHIFLKKSSLVLLLCHYDSACICRCMWGYNIWRYILFFFNSLWFMRLYYSNFVNLFYYFLLFLFTYYYSVFCNLCLEEENSHNYLPRTKQNSKLMIRTYIQMHIWKQMPIKPP